MIKPLHFLVVLLCVIGFYTQAQQSATKKSDPNKFKQLTNSEWAKVLSPDQYHILRERGTERAFTGKYWDNHDKGTYYCAGCKQELFKSETKYESGCGWPSFFKPADERAIQKRVDMSYKMVRDEILCSQCGGHLGHVFDDGPEPTGLRYCINSEALIFVKSK
jgi:peptide-methionine (R)-S-oxide reductase